MIEDNIVYENGWGGITLRQGVLEGDPGKSVDLRTIAIVRGNTVYNNGAASNGAAGLRNEGDNPIEMVNNILYVNSMAGLVDPFGANHHNLVSGNNGTAPVCEGPLPQRMPCQNMQFGLGMGGAPPGEGTLFQDPLFVDPGAHDYNLGPDSPAIDGGFDTGEREFNGVAPVMGASETDS